MADKYKLKVLYGKKVLEPLKIRMSKATKSKFAESGVFNFHMPVVFDESIPFGEAHTKYAKLTVN